MIAGAIRLLTVLVYFVVAAGLLVLVIIVVNRVVQLAAGLLGYEVGDFFKWVTSGFRRWRDKRRKDQLEENFEYGYPYRCRIVEVLSEHIKKELVGMKGMAHKMSNGSIVIFLDNGIHVWGYECAWEPIEDEGEKEDGSK